MDSLIKLKEVRADYCQIVRADILLLQETHLMGNDCPCLNRYGFNPLVHSGFGRGSRRAAILIHKCIPMTVTPKWKDMEGRDAMMAGTLYGQPITIKVYVPPPVSTP